MVRVLIRLALVAVVLLAVSCGKVASPWAAMFRQENPGRAAFSKGLVPSERAVLDDLSGATQYQIDLRVADGLSLQGRQWVLYTNREDIPLNEVFFRLLPNGAGGRLAVGQVTVNGQAIEMAYTSSNIALRAPLAAPLAPGRQVTLTLEFTLTVPREAGGNYGLLGYLGDMLVLDAFYPVIPVYDEDGWYVAPPPANADASYNDASYYLVRVTAPQRLTLVASGVEVERQRVGNEQVVTFAAGPARDFYLAASELYQVHVNDRAGEVRVNSYAHSGQDEPARWALRVAVDAIAILSREVGAYPYSEFDVISTPMVGALGIEYPGVVGITRRLYEGRGDDVRATLESTVAHEVAHQWFYNVVGNDQPGEPWLDEAMAQYLTMVYYRETYGEAAAQSVRESWNGRWARVDQVAKPIGLPAIEYTGREYGAIVYGRGPLFLQTLADKMGQPTWDAFMRDYYQSFKWGVATTEGFKQLAEEHCRCDLTPLFEEWVYGTQ